MSWYIKALKNAFNISGRARRKEYWMFVLSNMIISIVLGIILEVIQAPRESMHIYTLVILIPSITLAIRRMHDTNHRGWWGFVPIYGLYLLFKAGDPQENRFGPDPKKDLLPSASTTKQVA